MTWDRFVDVLPVLTLAIGYFGALYTERWRELRERERAILLGRVQVEQAALIELQDMLERLPARVMDLIQQQNAILEKGGSGHDALAISDVNDRNDAGFLANRAFTLAERIIEDDLRRLTYNELQTVTDIPYDWVERVRRCERGELNYAERWQAASRLKRALGSYLRQGSATPPKGPQSSVHSR